MPRRRAVLVVVPVCIVLLACGLATAGEWAIVIHGGAGTIRRADLDAATEAAYRDGLAAALDAGAAVLDAGGTSLDAVEATIRVMEDSPLFNAGKGAVFTAAGTNEMDASLMDGRTRDAGAVAGATTVRNPISAARAVMERSPHVMLAGAGADAFAAAVGLELAGPEYFFTERRWQAFLKARAAAGDTATAPAPERDGDPDPRRDPGLRPDPDRKHGTVGCVALDREGNIAAGTSTGGMTYKLWGRIGDAPIIGAGTWADNATCGVSATGHGEFFIRNAVAHDIAARMAYAGASLREAAEQVVLVELVAQGAEGGIIALDAAGNVAMVFNTPGMYRGWRKEDGAGEVEIFGGP